MPSPTRESDLATRRRMKALAINWRICQATGGRVTVLAADSGGPYRIVVERLGEKRMKRLAAVLAEFFAGPEGPEVGRD